ncbi:hypothetical protein PaecuDRAFT_0979 [Paenibacillus curdlanolyticus YK9]|uniref:Uncharacterized protein n=1 Tax=Paenibacillus curdlanolyticus YK9 TaxID=717606 RepID=E0I5Q7_9BACL|nr:hypothetical protein [Paenibacillus curdlanolyticus]EFM12299.1 hypothetical protein PaecuDRAFT_0979 [Paenibacillus curdlanolyticus YK9]
MPTDIKLDEGDGNHVVIEGAVVKTTASDFILDAPSRRRFGGIRRAMVHDGGDGLTINFNGDYPGGVTVGGDMLVTGEIRWNSASGNVRNLTEVVDRIQNSIRNSDPGRIERLEIGLASMAKLLNAEAVPPWRAYEEVEGHGYQNPGDHYPSAGTLGFIVEYRVFQGVPDGYYHHDVLHIIPPPGTLLSRGSTVVVEYCSAGWE